MGHASIQQQRSAGENVALSGDHQFAVVERKADGLDDIFVGNDIVDLQPVEFREDEGVGQHVLRVEVIEVLLLDIGMILHELMCLAHETKDLIEADVRFLMMDDFRTA